MENGRRIKLDVIYNNQNISHDIDPFITDFSYTDNFIGEADDVSITLGDREKKWTGSWMPQKGAAIKPSIIVSGWDSTNPIKRKLGYFEIDGLGISGPPSSVMIKGISVPESSSLRGEEKSKSWEKVTLKKVAQDIASLNKVKLHFDSSENPIYDRLDQESETDLSFLKRICSDAGLALKVTNNQIAILNELKFESASPVDTIKSTDDNLLNYQGDTTLNGVYKSCLVQYTDPKTKKTIKYLFTPPKAPKTGRILVVNEEVKNTAEAMRLAKNKLRAENKNATTMNLTISGPVSYYAGQTINLEKFGSFNGKYILTSVGMNGAKGTISTISLRKCLEGY